MRGLILWLMMFILVCSSLEPENVTCNKRDLKALQDFFNGIDSAKQYLNINSSPYCCNWPGILCSPDSNRVVKIELPQRNLSGRLLESIRYLDELVTLNLSANLFWGSLPSSIFLLQNLQVLDLSSNGFSGKIPDATNLASLKLLDLSENRLTGELASGLANMTNLTTLDISSNGFNGRIPNIFQKFHNLQFFLASSNFFNGGLPASLLNSSTLRSMVLRNNSLSGPLILHCGSTTNLTLLDLGSNRFSGPIPNNLSSCRKLQSINLSRNNLSGTIPANFRELNSLTFLSISNSSLQNISASLETLQHCKALSTLILTLNFLGEELPSTQSYQFEQINVLVIANCRLRGIIPSWLTSSRQLHLLDLSWNRLAGTIPPWIGDFKNLFYLDLSNNSLQGEIPRSIAQLDSLILSMNTTNTMNIPLFQKRNQSSRGLQYNRISSFPPTIDVSRNFLSGEIWPEFGNLKQLHILDLKFNNLSGTIPMELSSMTSLETLDLSYNNLSGSIPPTLSNLSFLSIFSVAYNHLYGEIPSDGQFATFTSSSFDGNPYLCLRCEASNQNTRRSTRNKRLVGIAAGIASSAVVFLFFISILTFRILPRNEEEEEENLAGAEDSDERSLVLVFNGEIMKDLILDDLMKATDNFDQANIIGCGGFGLVYKAALSDSRKVAIKRLSGECLQLEREFQAEVETLSRAQHPNLVLLQGYCKYNNDRLLIYTYMENNSVDYWLHEKIDGCSSLDWRTRLRIARGAARGLHYLHQSCDPHILHRDIKSSNILLDEDFEAHLADFGLARLIFPYDTHVTTDLVGTLGYIPPEYAQAPIASYKGDIYSFGVVILELLTGRRPMDMCKPKGSRDLVMWVREMTKENREAEVVDPFIYSKEHQKEILRVLDIACLCVDEFPNRRPCTQQLLYWLDKVDIEL